MAGGIPSPESNSAKDVDPGNTQKPYSQLFKKTPLQNKTSSSSKNTLTGVYNYSKDPSHYGRSIFECEEEWNREKTVGSFDQNLLTTLNNAKRAGRNEVIVLDFGSGDNVLFENFLNDNSYNSEAKKFLEENPRLKVRLVGLTDASSKELFGKTTKIPIRTPSKATQQITAEVFHYSITRGQTFESFLANAGIEQIDLLLATYSLTYLSPAVFHEVMDTSLNRLRTGGRLIAVAYNAHTPGIKSGLQGRFHTLRIEKNNKEDFERLNLKAMLEFGPDLIELPDIPIEKWVEAFRRTSDKLQALGVLSEKEREDTDLKIAEILNSKMPDSVKRLDLKDDVGDKLYNWVKRLVNKRIREMGEAKSRSLDYLKKTHTDDTSIFIGETTIVADRLAA